MRIRGTIYDITRMMSDFPRTYRRFFALREMENSLLLELLFYAISFSFFVAFYGWLDGSFVSVTPFVGGTHVCPPYFPSCGELYFLEALPYGYSHSAFYVF